MGTVCPADNIEPKTEFIPTLGNMIQEIEKILREVPKNLYFIYAKKFEATYTEEIIFRGKDFEEAASEYCREQGWREPS